MVAQYRQRVEIYLQFDGLTEASYVKLRGESLLDVKLQAVERLGNAGLNTILVSTVQPDVNEDQMGAIVQFGVERPWVTGASFQPATYSGRFVLPNDLERRITFPDVIQGVCAQTNDEWAETDFSPLPCAHPNAHTIAYAVRNQDRILPLARFVDLENHLDLLSGRITFDRERARHLIEEYLSRQACALEGCNSDTAAIPLKKSSGPSMSDTDTDMASDFFRRALDRELAPRHMFRITTTSFMDAYNFDIRQLMKSCVHFVLPSGHIIPFSAYNVLYRDGHVPLPVLSRSRHLAIS